MPSILFICTANICRSPMAAAIFRSLIEKEPDAAEWEIGSAGTWTVDGDDAAENTRLVAQNYGQNLSRHRSRNVTPRILEKADLILTMEAFHKEALQVEFPALRHKVFMLSEMVNLKIDVRDPYGSQLEDYTETAHLIEKYLRDGMGKIRSLVSA